MAKLTWGSFSIPSMLQSQRVAEIGRIVRGDRSRYEGLMAPDPDKLTDVQGGLYWGSFQHVLESALRMLSREMERRA